MFHPNICIVFFLNKLKKLKKKQEIDPTYNPTPIDATP